MTSCCNHQEQVQDSLFLWCSINTCWVKGNVLVFLLIEVLKTNIQLQFLVSSRFLKPKWGACEVCNSLSSCPHRRSPPLTSVLATVLLSPNSSCFSMGCFLSLELLKRKDLRCFNSHSSHDWETRCNLIRVGRRYVCLTHDTFSSFSKPTFIA